MTRPSETQLAMGQLAQMRTDRLMTEIAATPPTFTPSTVDLLTLPPSPEQRNQQLWEKLAPQQAAADKTKAFDTLAQAGWLRPSAPPRASTPFRSSGTAPPSLTPSRGMQLPSAPVSGGGGPSTAAATAAYGDSVGGVVLEAWEAYYTGANYLDWVRMGQYPWWWGPITGGLSQVGQRLAFDWSHMQKSKLPAYTKSIFTANISRAMTWVREQQAAYNARHGGPPVMH
jgi:hypothetical protein